MHVVLPPLPQILLLAVLPHLNAFSMPLAVLGPGTNINVAPRQLHGVLLEHLHTVIGHCELVQLEFVHLVFRFECLSTHHIGNTINNSATMHRRKLRNGHIHLVH